MGRWDLTAAITNGVIGSGVFSMPSAGALRAGAWSPRTVLLAGLGISTVVLCFAEVASRFDQAGGPYLYARQAFGPVVGFHVGWMHVWTRVLSAAAVLNVLVAYLAPLLPAAAGGFGRAAAMTAAMAVATAINVAGVRQSALAVDLLTVLKILPLLAVAVAGAFLFRRETLLSQSVPSPDWAGAVLLLVYAYAGFESSVIAASEAKSPRRDMAFALIVSVVVVTGVYSLVQLAVLGTLPHAARDAAPVATALGLALGGAGRIAGSLAAIVSAWGWLVGFSLMTPRILFSMGERGEIPPLFARVHPRYRTPAVAIVVNSLLSLGFALASGFAAAATLSAITRLGIFALTCVALPVLRRRGGAPPGFRLAGGALIAPLGLGFCLWLLLSRSLIEGWVLPLLMAAGAVVWRFRRPRRDDVGSPPEEAPCPSPVEPS